MSSRVPLISLCFPQQGAVISANSNAGSTWEQHWISVLLYKSDGIEFLIIRFAGSDTDKSVTGTSKHVCVTSFVCLRKYSF